MTCEEVLRPVVPGFSDQALDNRGPRAISSVRTSATGPGAKALEGGVTARALCQVFSGRSGWQAHSPDHVFQKQ